MDRKIINLETYHITLIQYQTDNIIVQETQQMTVMKSISWRRQFPESHYSIVAPIERVSVKILLTNGKFDITKLEKLKFLTAADEQALKIEGQVEVLVKSNGLSMTHIYVVSYLSYPVIVEVDWLTLNQAKLDFQNNLVTSHDDLVIASYNHIAEDLSNTLTTEDFCIIPPRTKQIFNATSSNTRIEGRLLTIEPLTCHD